MWHRRDAVSYGGKGKGRAVVDIRMLSYFNVYLYRKPANLQNMINLRKRNLVSSKLCKRKHLIYLVISYFKYPIR